MINQQINLYQERFREVKPFMSATHGLALLALTVVLLAGSSVWYQNQLAESEQAHQLKLQQKQQVTDQFLALKTRLESQLADKRIEQQLQAVKKDIAVRNKMIQFVSGNQLGTGSGYGNTLGELAQLNIKDLWLSRISLSENFISLSGSALKAENVPQYFKLLQQRELFAGKEFEIFKLARKSEKNWKVDFVIASRDSANE